MRVFIGCSHQESVAIKYRDLVTEVASLIAKRGHKLVFDGINTGMMEKCYMTFKYEGSRIKAIVDIKDTDLLENLEIDAYDVTTTTFSRTESIYKSSELCLFLPGGIGTISEFLAMVLEEKKHKKKTPIILFNYDHYYDHIISFLKEAYKDNFIEASDLKLFEIVTNCKSLALYLDSLTERKEEK